MDFIIMSLCLHQLLFSEVTDFGLIHAHPNWTFAHKLEINNHKTVLNEKILITFSTSFKLESNF